MKHIKGLDTLRTFSVLLVIIAHWGPHKFSSAALTFIFTNLVPAGTFGVDVFFVLSGYLITNILLKARDEASPGGKLQIVKSFYIRRILRIFPIYFMLAFILAYVLDNEYVKDHLVYYLTYTSNILTFKVNAWEGFSHTWSLAVEEQFYIIWPWIIIYAPKRYLFQIILFSLFAGIAGTQILFNAYGEFSGVLLLPCITAFAIGALYAYVVNCQQYKKWVVKIFLILLPVCLVLLYLHQQGHKLVVIRAVNALIAINLIMYICNERYNFVTRSILNNKFLVGIGKISYGVYLYHYFLPYYWLKFVTYLKGSIHLSDKAFKLLTVPPSGYLAQLLLLLTIAWFSYRYIEFNFLKLKKYFNYISHKKQALGGATIA